MRPLYQMIAATAGLGLAMSPILVIAQPKPDRAVSVCMDKRACDAPKIRSGTGIVVGDIIDAAQVTLVTHPGRYGLSDAPHGNGYGVMDGHLIRFDRASGQIRSVLRSVNFPND